ncbi:MAG: C25 family peptidase propeptide domain-containing protein, partial [Planctomycetota bacterium]
MRQHGWTRTAIVSLTILMTGGSVAGGQVAEPAPCADSQCTLSVPIPVGTYRITRTNRGDEIAAEDFGSLLVPGKPQLPSKIFALAIPPGADVVGVDYAVGEKVVLPGTYAIPPAPLPRVIGREVPALYERDRALYQENFNSVYGRDEAYPPQIVELVRTAGYRKYNLVDVRVNPFAYHPQSERLIHYPKITVQVTYRPAQNGRAGVIDDLAAAERTAQQLILNHHDTAGWYPQQQPRAVGLHDYVIITLDALVSAVTPLVNWETTKGRTVNVVTT